MHDSPGCPTELDYRYYFLSVVQPEGDDGPASAQLLKQFKPSLEELVQGMVSGRAVRPGAKRKVGVVCPLGGGRAELMEDVA